MGDIKRAIFGATNTNDQPQTHKADTKGSEGSEAADSPGRVENDQGDPRPVADPDGPTHKQPSSGTPPEAPSEHTGEGYTDDYDTPSDQTRS